jgi:hypothetical protein
MPINTTILNTNESHSMLITINVAAQTPLKLTSTRHQLSSLETSIPDSIHRTFDWGLHKHWNTAIFHDKIQRIGTLVFEGLVNERTDQEMTSLYTAVIPFKVRIRCLKNFLNLKIKRSCLQRFLVLYKSSNVLRLLNMIVGTYLSRINYPEENVKTQ